MWLSSIGAALRSLEWRSSLRLLLLLPVFTVVMGACAAGDAASVSFLQPVDGAVVASPVHVEMRAEGFTIEPAAEGVRVNSGHFHIMIDAPCVEARLTVGSDDRHLHFGGGQSTASLDLEPGEHTLCLQAADGAHTAKNIVDMITITVEE